MDWISDFSPHLWSTASQRLSFRRGMSGASMFPASPGDSARGRSLLRLPSARTKAPASATRHALPAASARTKAPASATRHALPAANAVIVARARGRIDATLGVSSGVPKCEGLGVPSHRVASRLCLHRRQAPAPLSRSQASSSHSIHRPVLGVKNWSKPVWARSSSEYLQQTKNRDAPRPSRGRKPQRDGEKDVDASGH